MAGRGAVALGLGEIMHVMAGAAGTKLAVIAEQALQLFQQIGVEAEMAEMMVAAGFFLGGFLPHGGAVVTVEGVAFDIGGLDFLAPENLLERVADRGGASAG